VDGLGYGIIPKTTHAGFSKFSSPSSRITRNPAPSACHQTRAYPCRIEAPLVRLPHFGHALLSNPKIVIHLGGMGQEIGDDGVDLAEGDRWILLDDLLGGGPVAKGADNGMQGRKPWYVPYFFFPAPRRTGLGVLHHPPPSLRHPR
jgi:hypothetical protein